MTLRSLAVTLVQNDRVKVRNRFEIRSYEKSNKQAW